jgi:hypothetical protein
MKACGLASPDLGDCLAMTFADTVQRKEPGPIRSLSASGIVRGRERENARLIPCFARSLRACGNEFG